MQPDHDAVAIGGGGAGKAEFKRAIGDVREVLHVDEGQQSRAALRQDVLRCRGQQPVHGGVLVARGGIGPDARAFPGLGPLQRQQFGRDQIGELVDQDAVVVGGTDAHKAGQRLVGPHGHQIDGPFVVAVVQLGRAEAPELGPAPLVDVVALADLEHLPELARIEVSVIGGDDVDHFGLPGGTRGHVSARAAADWNGAKGLVVRVCGAGQRPATRLGSIPGRPD